MAIEANGLTLTVAPRGEGGTKLVPEQSALFDLKLRNGGGQVQLPSLDGNRFTPVLRVYDAGGVLVRQATPADLFSRFSPIPPSARLTRDVRPLPPTMLTLRPGQEVTSWVDLFTQTDPLPRGRYQLEVLHRLRPEGDGAITGNRVAFEVVDARVEEAALGFQSSARRESVLAWIATPESGGAPRLMVRLSTLFRHSTAHMPGCFIEEAPAGTRLAVSGGAPARSTAEWSWVAVSGPGRVEVIRQFEGRAGWRSRPIALPLRDVRPVPGFPDREDHAVFLATGTNYGGQAALAGAVVNPEQSAPPKAWSVPLRHAPDASACIFGRTKEIAILMLAAGSSAAALSRIDVQEDGSVFAPETQVRVTPNEVLALYADEREHQRPVFVVLEADRKRPDRLTLVTVPPRGEPEVRELGAVPGWPVIEEKQARRPSRAVRLSLATSWQGVPLIALIDELGRYYGGALDGSPLRRMDADGGPRVVLPHIAAMGQNAPTFAGFTSHGVLAYLSGLGR